MKKLCVLSVAALALALLPQQASAWSNIKLGAGFNFHWQTGDNHIGKHIYHNGPVPHPYGYGQGFGHGPQVIVVDQNQGNHGDNSDEVKAPAVNQAQTVPMSPYHYSSYQGGYYYQEPGYYYGQNYWYGW